MKTYQEKFEQATMDYGISARDYFLILKLAIHRLSGAYLKTSVEVAQYDITEPMYQLAYRLVRAIGKEIKKMNNRINYNVDDFGVLRVYRGNTILFEAQDFSNTPKEEIENFIDENLQGEQ